MPPIATDVAQTRVFVSVCLSVCTLRTRMICAETAEPTENRGAYLMTIAVGVVGGHGFVRCHSPRVQAVPLLPQSLQSLLQHAAHRDWRLSRHRSNTGLTFMESCPHQLGPFTRGCRTTVDVNDALKLSQLIIQKIDREPLCQRINSLPREGGCI